METAWNKIEVNILDAAKEAVGKHMIKNRRAKKDYTMVHGGSETNNRRNGKDLYGAQRKIWKLLKTRKAEISETVRINAINKAVWKQYFTNLYSMSESEDVNSEEEAIAESEGEDILTIEQEVQDTITELKGRKAPGVDEISNEFLKS
ncbi:hypothetical protein ANN_10853 [Periplaneta americana]|uniref:Uncharacterized protein n=1 Tax=Periplaneta americana TaxID=6978 RepID=A0ABQ8T4N0_PERAM|nr:hypothetical protein ANN_10853 [Periplaneta americana]